MVVAHLCNPRNLRGQNRRITWSQTFETRLGNIRTCCIQKIFLNTKPWWCAPVVPATREIMGQGVLYPGSLRLKWAIILPPHTSLRDKVRPSVKKKLWISGMLKYIHLVMRKASRGSTSCKTKTQYPLNNNCPFYPLSSPWQTPFSFVFLWVWLFNLSHKWNHVVFIILLLVYFMWHNIFKVYPKMWQNLLF